MTAPVAPVCPVCAGPRLDPHPAGLVFRHSTACALLAAEDGRKIADLELLAREGWPVSRPATPTERTLLLAAGFDLPPDDPANPAATATTLTRLTPGTVRRTWPGFEPMP